MNINIAVNCFSNLGHQKRLKIIKLLVRAAPNGLTMGEIASNTRTPNSTLTHHIKLLEEVGLIARQQEAQSIRCLINIDLIKALAEFLLEECCIETHKSC